MLWVMVVPLVVDFDTVSGDDIKTEKREVKLRSFCSDDLPSFSARSGNGGDGENVKVES